MINVDDPRLGLIDTATRPEASPRATTSGETADGREEALAEAFDQLLREVVRPEMETAGIRLERHRYEYEIIIEPGRQITMRMCPPSGEPGRRASACPVYVRFTRDASSTAVHVFQGTIAADGDDGATITWTVPALQLTRSEVARLIVNTCLRAGHVALGRGTRYRADHR